MSRGPLDRQQIIEFLDEVLEVEFTFVKSEIPAEAIAAQPRHTQDFILNLTQRVSATNIELAYQFACNAQRALESMDMHMVEAWAMSATDNYDKTGLIPAMSVIRELDNFVHHAQVRACGAVLEEESSVLLPFLHGLSGRKLKIAELDLTDTSLHNPGHAFTDTETIFLPPVMALMEEKRDNFLVYKATLAYLWAQIRFGTFRVDFEPLLGDEASLRKYCALESIRLDACIQRELPGLFRDVQKIRQQLAAGDESRPADQALAQALSSKTASAKTSLDLLEHIDSDNCPATYCYQGSIRLDIVRDVMHKRIEKEKTYFRVALGEIACDMTERNEDDSKTDSADKPLFNIRRQDEDSHQAQSGTIELELEGELVAVPEHVRELMTSIVVDFGGIPPEYLYAAGPGEYDLKKYEDEHQNPDDVWKGTYHEEGAELYNEWNFKRQHYHKNWCVLREIEVQPEYNDFADQTLDKYKGLLKSLRHTFEILRGEDRLLKKQPYGDDIDIDALVEALGDARVGMEMSNCVFTKMHKEERNVAVIFMVDMSGSTRGWINKAERESLILLSEALNILGDRYAIYGFSGMTRKRCDLYKIKSFDEPYDDLIKARISNIQPHDYTRMGVFIRHMTKMFDEVEASTRLLITLSDGKPDDYDTYRGEYGVEDTRQALYEASRNGIHSFCITIDEKARDYLPHMYGAANYAVIDDVSKLPLKVSDIYRRITT